MIIEESILDAYFKGKNIRPEKFILDAYFKGEDISSENLKKVIAYRDECIQKALSPERTCPYDDLSSEVFKLLSKLFKELFREQFPGRKVIELGPGASPIAKELFDLGIAEYIAVEPFHADLTEKMLPNDKRTSLVRDRGGLTYLLGQPPNSSLVVSLGFICPELFGLENNDYFRFLGREIYKVTPEKAITVHTTNLLTSNPDVFFIEHGFKPEELYPGAWVFKK